MKKTALTINGRKIVRQGKRLVVEINTGRGKAFTHLTKENIMYTEALTFPTQQTKSEEEVNFITENINTLFRAVCDVEYLLRDYPLGKEEDYTNKKSYQKAKQEKKKAEMCIRTVFQYARSHLYYLTYDTAHEED